MAKRSKVGAGASGGVKAAAGKSKKGSIWRSRIVGHGRVNPLEIVAHPANYKAHPDQQKAGLKEAIAGVGFLRSVTVNKRTGTLIDGHLRVALAIEQQQPEIDVEFVDLSQAEERKALAIMDPLAGMAEVDNDALAKLISDLEMPDVEALLRDAHGIIDGADQAGPTRRQSAITPAGTQVTIGSYRFPVPRKVYEPWIEAIRQKVGFEEKEVIGELKKRLKLPG